MRIMEPSARIRRTAASSPVRTQASSGRRWPLSTACQAAGSVRCQASPTTLTTVVRSAACASATKNTENAENAANAPVIRAALRVPAAHEERAAPNAPEGWPILRFMGRSR